MTEEKLWCVTTREGDIGYCDVPTCGELITEYYINNVFVQDIVFQKLQGVASMSGKRISPMSNGYLELADILLATWRFRST